MLDHLEIQLALRARLRAVVVCTTGVTALSATATGYARSTGSFVADGFRRGMELRGSGFASAINNGVGVITGVTDTTLGVAMLVVTMVGDVRTITRPANVREAENAGRSLTVGLPSFGAKENEDFTPENGVPYWDEQYVRGPAQLDTIGPDGRISAEPMFLPRINVPLNTGISAASLYGDAFVNAFPPGDKIIVINGNVIEVRADAAPYGGQLLPGKAGFSGLLCTIPLRCRSINSI